MTESYLHILVEAKNEYTSQLASILTSPMYEGISSIYKHAKKTSKSNNLLVKFQELLSKIPNWSAETLEREFQRIMLYSKCDWISDLITAVFISHTKVLASIHLGNKKRDIELKIPTPLRFIHTIYVAIAREFWKNPYLLYDIDVSSREQQRNLRDSENIIRDCINNSIRKLLPVKHIIKEYLGENDTSSIYTEDITSTLSNLHIEKIKKMVEVDMQNMNIDNRPEDYTNHIEDDDIESILTIPTIVKNEPKEELEESFKDYDAGNEKNIIEVIEINDTKNTTNIIEKINKVDSNDNDDNDNDDNDKDENNQENTSSESIDKQSNFSTLSKRLRLLRTHDRPILKNSSSTSVF